MACWMCLREIALKGHFTNSFDFATIMNEFVLYATSRVADMRRRKQRSEVDGTSALDHSTTTKLKRLALTSGTVTITTAISAKTTMEVGLQITADYIG